MALLSHGAIGFFLLSRSHMPPSLDPTIAIAQNLSHGMIFSPSFSMKVEKNQNPFILLPTNWNLSYATQVNDFKLNHY
jgi:hypothetical protein